MPQVENVTMKGNPVELIGSDIAVGDKIPEVSLTANDLSQVQLSSFQGKTLVILAVPSLDTPVCDKETRRFNEEAANLGDNVQIVCVSVDLPFAQKRWCGGAGIDRVVTLSDHRGTDFGKNFGVLVAGPRLLARAIFVVDAAGTLRYKQIVNEITQEPNYDEALNAIKKL